MMDSSPEEDPVEMSLPPVVRARIEALMAEVSDDFLTLVRAAGLDPKSSFRGKILQLDFGDADLAEFDLSGADLSDCDLSNAKLEGAILTGSVRHSGLRVLKIVGHSHPITSVAISPDGRRIVSGGHDCTLRFWDATTGVPLSAPLFGYQGGITSVSFSPDGCLIASGGYAGTVRLWDTNTFTARGEHLKGHEGGVTSVAFSPDGHRIISGGRDGTLRTWDANTGAPLDEPPRVHQGGVTSVAFSPDGRRIISGGDDSGILLWDTANSTAQGEYLRGHQGVVTTIAFSPDGNLILGAGQDGTLRFWDATTGAPLGEPLRGHSGWVRSVAFSPDGRRITSGGDDGTLRTWDSATGMRLGKPLLVPDDSVYCLAFSPDGHRIVSGGSDGALRIWFLGSHLNSLVVIFCHTKNLAEAELLVQRLRSVPDLQEIGVQFWIDLNGIEQSSSWKDRITGSMEHSPVCLLLLDEKGSSSFEATNLPMIQTQGQFAGRPTLTAVILSNSEGRTAPDSTAIGDPLRNPQAFEELVRLIRRAVAPPTERPADQKLSRGLAFGDPLSGDRVEIVETSEGHSGAWPELPQKTEAD